MDTLLQLSLVCALLALFSLLWLVARAFTYSSLWGFAVLLFSPPGALVYGIRYWRREKRPFLAYLASLLAATGLGLSVFTAWGGWELARAALQVHEGIQTRTLSDRDAYTFLSASLGFIGNANLPDPERRKLDVIRWFLNNHPARLSAVERRQLHDEIAALLANEDLDGNQRRELEYLRRQLARSRTENVAAPQPVVVEAPPPPGERRILSKRPSATKAQYRTDYRIIPISEAGNYVGKSVKVTRHNSDEQECKLVGATAHSLRFEQRGGGGTFVFEYYKRDIEELKLLTRLES